MLSVLKKIPVFAAVQCTGRSVRCVTGRVPSCVWRSLTGLCDIIPAGSALFDPSWTTSAEAWGNSGILKGEAMADILAVLSESSLFQTRTHTLKNTHSNLTFVFDFF